MSNWTLAVVVVGGAVVASLTGFAAFKRASPKPFASGELGIASQLVSVMATLNSLLLAFMAVSVWDAYKAADSAALAEATSLTMVTRDLAVYGGKTALAARESARLYGRCVIDKEWSELAEGRSAPECLDGMNAIFLAIGELEPRTEREKILLAEIWGRVNVLAGHRRERLQSSRTDVPPTLWAVVVVGTILTIAGSYTLPAVAFGRTMIAMLACSYGLVFFFIVAMKQPFAGPDRVRPDAIERVLKNMSRFDAAAAKHRK